MKIIRFVAAMLTLTLTAATSGLGICYIVVAIITALFGSKPGVVQSSCDWVLLIMAISHVLVHIMYLSAQRNLTTREDWLYRWINGIDK